MFTNKAHIDWIKFVLFGEEKCHIADTYDEEDELYIVETDYDDYAVRIIGDTAKVVNLDYPSQELDYKKGDLLEVIETFGASHKWEEELESYKGAGGNND